MKGVVFSHAIVWGLCYTPDIEKQEKGTGKGGDASYICFSSLASPSPQQATQHNTMS